MISRDVQDWITGGVVAVTALLFLRGIFARRRRKACPGCSNCGRADAPPPEAAPRSPVPGVHYGEGLARSLERVQNGNLKDR